MSEPIENTLNHADRIHPNVLAHRKRLADKIDAEEAAAQEIRMGSLHCLIPDCDCALTHSKDSF